MSLEPLLEMSGISKRFGPTHALKSVSIQVFSHEVHALIGENGAGKSTLLKVLSGAHTPDSGSLKIDGQAFVPSGPHHARAAGIAMIYQELNLAPDLSVEDNILLGQHGTGGGLLFRRYQRTKVRKALEAVGLNSLDPRAIVGRQSVATQQLIEIARALASDARIILFDEPTSSLPQKDVQRLFEIISQLKARGIGIIYISHFLEEVREVADRFTVLRDGTHVGSGEISDISDEKIISLMVGRAVDDLFPHVPHSPGEGLVRVDKLNGSPAPRQASFELRRGEIFGVAGLVGAGRTELLRCLFGLDYVRSGQVFIRDKIVPRSVRASMRAGLGLLSEDRKNEGLAQGLSITDNIMLSNLTPYTTLGWLNLGRLRQSAQAMADQVAVKAHSTSQAVSELSGGNQQKVAIARILHQKSNVLLMDEPTKGIDVGTKAEIYRMMGELAAEGKTIVFVSSYLPELMAVCDRIAVMSRGELREIRDTVHWTEEEVLQCAIASDDQWER